MPDALKVLVASTAGAGHFAGVHPFAQACADLGHDVRVAAPRSFAPAVQRAGFAHEPVADVEPALLGSVFGRLPMLARDDANAVVVQEVFGRLNTVAALPAMRALCDRWRPDFVIREPAELSSYVAACERGIPHVQANIGLASFDDLVLPLFDAPLQEFGSDGDSLRQAPRWSTLPPTFDVPAEHATGPLTHARELADVDTTPSPLPDWWNGSGDPLVYVTFGSVAAALGLFPRFYQRVLDQLTGVAARVVLTLGEAGDPAAFGAVPANVHIERWWPQRDLMPEAALVVGHGGFGTTQSALVAGRPQIAIPLFSSDQFANAARLQSVGVGVALMDPEEALRQGGVSPQGPEAVDRLGETVVGLLADDEVRRTARALAMEAQSLPAAAECVEALTTGL